MTQVPNGWFAPQTAPLRRVGAAPKAAAQFMTPMPAGADFPERRLAAKVDGERNTIMPQERLTIRTSDGECPSDLFTPASGDGPWPAVVVTWTRAASGQR